MILDGEFEENLPVACPERNGNQCRRALYDYEKPNSHKYVELPCYHSGERSVTVLKHENLGANHEAKRVHL